MKCRRNVAREHLSHTRAHGSKIERSRHPPHPRRILRQRMDASTAAGRRRLYRQLSRGQQQPGSGTALAVMRARTWTFPVPDLRHVLSVHYAIAGGVATRLYMQERDADDLDIVVRPADGERAIGDLRLAGVIPVRCHPSGGTRWLLPGGTYLDVLTLTAPWVDEALANLGRAPDGQPVVSLPYLVVMKLSSYWKHDGGDLARMVGDLDDSGLAPVREAVARHIPDAADDLEWLIERGRLEYM